MGLPSPRMVQTKACDNAEDKGQDSQEESEKNNNLSADGPIIPRKPDRLNASIAVVIAVGGLERAAYYAVTTPWRKRVSPQTLAR